MKKKTLIFLVTILSTFVMRGKELGLNKELENIDSSSIVFELKEKIKKSINDNDDLNFNQKRELLRIVEDIKDENFLDKFKTNLSLIYNNISNLKNTILSAEEEINTFKLKESKIPLKLEIDKAKIVKNSTDFDLEKLEDNRKSLEKSIEDLKKAIKLNLEEPKYIEVADSFYYTNHDLFDKLRDDVYFDVKFNQHVLKDNDSLGGITLGGNYEFKDLGLKLGGFVEYDNNKAHNISFGTGVFYDDFSSFARYRLAILKKDTNLLNHNFDILVKYSHNFNFDKLNVEPMGSIYATISSKAKIDEFVTLKQRFGFNLNLGTKVSYDVLENLNLYTTPSFTIGYNNQNLENEKTNQEKEIKRSYFNYAIDFGAKYTKDNFVIRPSIKLNGDINKNLNFGANFGIGYNF